MCLLLGLQEEDRSC